jgi:hypothetical protein
VAASAISEIAVPARVVTIVPVRGDRDRRHTVVGPERLRRSAALLVEPEASVLPAQYVVVASREQRMDVKRRYLASE